MFNVFLIGVSAFFLFSSLFLFRKFNLRIISKMILFLLGLFLIFLIVFYGISDYFTGEGITDATIFHIHYGFEGIGFFDFWEVVFISLSALLFNIYFTFVLVFSRQKNSNFSKNNYILPILGLILSFLVNPAVSDLYRLSSYLKNLVKKQNEDLDFYKYYKTPHIVRTLREKKNIVYIYAESLERTFFDESLFPGLFNNLKQLEARSIYFTDIKQVKNTEWTIAGMVASQFGVPLFTHTSVMSMKGMDNFLPLAVGLGDLLHSQDYYLAYLGGANLSFTGKGKLYKSHGFSEVKGFQELKNQLNDKNYRSRWGLYDDTLFDIAYKRFTDLSASDKKFGLFLLTLDTHMDGHSGACQDIKYGDGMDEVLNALACSDYLLSNFIKRILASPYADKTVIVLSSDHLSKRRYVIQKFKKKERRLLFMIIDPNNQTTRKIDIPGSILDISTTILPFLGYEGKVGLGRNLLNDNDNLREELKFIQDKNVLLRWRQNILNFWEFPKISEHVKIDVENKQVFIDEREFRFPILIELENDLQTLLKFDFSKEPWEKSISDHAKIIDKNKGFILIDNSVDIKNLLDSKRIKNSIEEAEEGYYFLAGRGEKYSKLFKMDKNFTFMKDEIRKLIEP